MSKKFNGHRCERRNLTDLVLGTGPTGARRSTPKANSRPRNYTTEPAVNKKIFGGDNSKEKLTRLAKGAGLMTLGAVGGPAGMVLANLLSQRSQDFQADPAVTPVAPVQAEPKQSTVLTTDQKTAQLSEDGIPDESINMYGDTTAVQKMQFGGMPDMQMQEVLAALAQLEESEDPNAQNIVSQVTQDPQRLKQLLEKIKGAGGIEALQGAPGTLPEKLNKFLGKQGGLNLVSAGGQALGSFITQNADSVTDPRKDFSGQEAVGGAISGAFNPLAMAFGPVGMGVGALVGAGKQFFDHKKEQDAFNTQMAEEKLQRARMGAESAQQFSNQVLSTYDQTGLGGGFYARKGGPVDKFYHGGQVDYETEKNEVILASPNDPPVAMGQGGYNKLSANLYKGNGPSHEMGGIPTRGATEPFVDAGGQKQDSPYVFSDAKEMRFDASDILSMIR